MENKDAVSVSELSSPCVELPHSLLEFYSHLASTSASLPIDKFLVRLYTLHIGGTPEPHRLAPDELDGWSFDLS